MPKTAKELVKLKLNSLEAKLQNSVGRVNKLQEMVDSPSPDLSVLNFTIDNLLLSMDDFMSNFDENDEEIKVQFVQSSPSAAAHEDVTKTEAEMADINSRVSSIEQIVSEMKKTMYGDGGREASSEIGILRHVHDLENSFNEEKQKLIGFDERLEQVNMKCDSLIDDVRQEKTKEDQHSTAVMEERMRAAILENCICHNRLTCVEDQVKALNSVDSPKATNDEVVPLKTELAQLRLKTESLDDFTRTAIVNRIQVLENHPVVVFNAVVKHKGPWKKGTVIKESEVLLNIGNSFEEDGCRFVAPVNGIYCFNLFVAARVDLMIIQVWTCTEGGGEWVKEVCEISVRDNHSKNDTLIEYLKKGQTVCLRVFGGNQYHRCFFHGWLITPT